MKDLVELHSSITTALAANKTFCLILLKGKKDLSNNTDEAIINPSKYCYNIIIKARDPEFSLDLCFKRDII